jgi:hypothetical protein
MSGPLKVLWLLELYFTLEWRKFTSTYQGGRKIIIVAKSRQELWASPGKMLGH